MSYLGLSGITEADYRQQDIALRHKEYELARRGQWIDIALKIILPGAALLGIFSVGDLLIGKAKGRS